MSEGETHRGRDALDVRENGRLGLGTRRVVPPLLLLPLVVVVVVAACWMPWRGELGVDTRTYVEMIAGIRDHGLPFTINSHASVFPEARPRFNLGDGERLWGVYPPVYPYVAAVALKLGGLSWIHKQNIAIVGLLALAAYALATRLARTSPDVAPRRLRGVAAAWVVAIGTPAWVSSFETLALPLLSLWLVLGAYFAIVSIEARGARMLLASAACGLCGGLATGTHLNAFPASLAFLAALLLVNAQNAPKAEGAGLVRRLLPDPSGVARFAVATVALALVLAPIAVLNKARFGLPNPVMYYQQCVWNECQSTTHDQLHMGVLLRWASPALPYFLATGVGLLVARKRWWAVLLVLSASAAVLLLRTTPSERAWLMLRTAYGYFADNSLIDFVSQDRADDGLGNFYGQPVIKSLLQQVPILLVAFTLPFGRHGRGGRVLVVIAPVLALFASLSLLGILEGAMAFGWPYMFLRYAVPASPLLAVLAVEAIADLPWRGIHIFFAIAVGVGFFFYFFPYLEDWHRVRRIFELRVTLLLAVLAAASVALAHRFKHDILHEAALVSSAAAIGMGVGIACGVDGRMMADHMTKIEKRLVAFEKVCPDRKLAIVGWGPNSDPVLPLRAARDIHYIDLVESDGGTWINFRQMIDVWTDDGRPIYGIFPIGLRWPYADWDVPAVELDGREGFWKIGPPKRRVPIQEVRDAWDAHRRTRPERERAAVAAEQRAKWEAAYWRRYRIQIYAEQERTLRLGQIVW